MGRVKTWDSQDNQAMKIVKENMLNVAFQTVARSFTVMYLYPKWL
jgi:hypothetical protein